MNSNYARVKNICYICHNVTNCQQVLVDLLLLQGNKELEKNKFIRLFVLAMANNLWRLSIP